MNPSPSVLRLVPFCLLALAPAAASASEPRFWRIETAEAFLKGDSEGTAVDSDGHLRLALASDELHDPETASIWSLARSRRGVTWAGTGDGGVVYRVEAGQGQPLQETPSPHVYAIALGPDDRLYIAYSPDGRVEAVSSSGAVEAVFDSQDRYIWDLAFDGEGRLLVATGASGRVYRVSEGVEAETLLESAETHITALAVGADGTVYAGSTPGGILYRIAPAGDVFALHDSAYDEVKAIAVAGPGRVYAALVGAGAVQPEPRPPASPTPPTTPAAQVTVAARVAGVALTTPTSPTGGAVLLLQPGAAPEALWRSTDAAPHALLAVDGGVLVGTGDDAELFLVRDDRSWAMQGTFPAAQITALARGGDGRLVLATSNPGRIFELSESQMVEEGEFVSEIHDSGLPSLWGRLGWEAEVPSGAVVTVQTRSGNTSSPDATWSEWSAPATNPARARVESEEARFLQVKATLRGSSAAAPRLASIHAAYLQRNQRPRVGRITVHPPGKVFQKPVAVSNEPEILGLDPADGVPAQVGAAAVNAAGTGRPLFRRGLQMLTWSATDANGDELEYDVEYRPAEESGFRTLRSGLEEAVLTWDTTSVPDGRYVVRVLASDRRANPSPLALAGEQESTPFRVDNTPPRIALEASPDDPASIRAEVRDTASPIRRLEYSLDAGRWVEAHPEDGIADSRSETFALRPVDGGGRRVLVVRAFDRHGNTASAMMELDRR